MMPILEYVPATLKVMLVFIIVLIAIRRKISLGNAFLLGSVLMGVIFGLKPKTILSSIASSVLYPKTMSLAVIIALILVLSSTMEKVGQMKRLLLHFQGLISSKLLNLVMFPAIIGLLPMPGGALFSAPMVKELGEQTALASDKLGFINYWYRHIWEYWWPLYPGVLLATALAGLNLWKFVTIMVPLSVTAMVSGLFSIRGLNDNTQPLRPPLKARPPLKPFLNELSPILFVIVFGLGMGVFLSSYFPQWSVSREIGLITALCIAIGWIWVENNCPKTDIRKILTNPGLLGMMYMVIAILIFKGMLEDSHAVALISQEFRTNHMPITLITALLPLLVGVVTGITIAFVGGTFPILILLIQSYGETQFMTAYIMLAMTCGFIGVLFSPLHLCLLLTNQYFSCRLAQSYKWLWLPCLLLFAFSSAYFYLLRYFFA
ncbi:MAG: DUF401 family protein [Deltaproteobacteria bacterium]|nr:DUF401 family protein [Deltaproteobacteria bacterium]